MAVLEALAHGIPCLVTPGTNMAGPVADAEAGYRVEPSAPAIAKGLLQILRHADRLVDRGAKARALAAQRYRWQSVAEQTVSHYRRHAA